MNGPWVEVDLAGHQSISAEEHITVYTIRTYIVNIYCIVFVFFGFYSSLTLYM